MRIYAFDISRWRQDSDYYKSSSLTLTRLFSIKLLLVDTTQKNGFAERSKNFS